VTSCFQLYVTFGAVGLLLSLHAIKAITIETTIMARTESFIDNLHITLLLSNSEPMPNKRKHPITTWYRDQAGSA
jgi:hypothetical protein